MTDLWYYIKEEPHKDTFTLDHAKEHLEELAVRAARGEQVRIVDPRHGAMRLVPGNGQATRKVIFGQWKDRISDILEDRLLTPLDDDELAWLSGEMSPVDG